MQTLIIKRMSQICITPRVDGLAGVASFRLKFEDGLRARGVKITHNIKEPSDAIIVLGGTRQLPALWNMRSRGRKVVQRLDGINWVHKKRNTGLKHYIRAEYGNFVLSFIRSRIATDVIYQSEFSSTWWENWYSKTKIPSSVIYNGVDLSVYTPVEIPKAQPFKILLVEGSLGGGYDMGLDNAVRLAEILQEEHNLPVELVVVGKITDKHKKQAEAKTTVHINWMGRVPRERIPEIDNSAHLLFSADLNAACPNSVIEALACGLPVLSFDTGALNELVIGDSGRVVPYGGNPWIIDPPDVDSLANAAVEILQNQPRFRESARRQAEKNLGLDMMVDKYIEVLIGNE